MHGLIYAVLSMLLLAAWRRAGQPALTLRRLAALAALVAAVGFVQESLQWISQGIAPWRGVALSASLFDLGIDLGGGCVGIGVERLWRLRHRY